MCPLTCTFVAYRTDGSLSKGHSVDAFLVMNSVNHHTQFISIKCSCASGFSLKISLIQIKIETGGGVSMSTEGGSYKNSQMLFCK